MFTKDQIKAVMNLWETKTVRQIADELRVKAESIQYIATAIRNAGYKLPKKRVKGHLRLLIEEVLSER